MSSILQQGDCVCVFMSIHTGLYMCVSLWTFLLLLTFPHPTMCTHAKLSVPLCVVLCVVLSFLSFFLLPPLSLPLLAFFSPHQSALFKLLQTLDSDSVYSSLPLLNAKRAFKTLLIYWGLQNPLDYTHTHTHTHTHTNMTPYPPVPT